MAENRIEFSDFIDPKLISELDKLEKKLQDLDKTLTHMKEGQGEFVDPKGFSEYQKELEKLNQKIKEAEGLEKERLRIELERSKVMTKLEAAEQGYTKELEIQKQKLNERNKAIREEIKNGKMAADSIKALRERNKILRQEMDKLSISTKEGREQMDRYRAEIDANTEAIRENTDADRKRTMTIGEYRQEVKAAVGDMGLFGVSINGIGEALNKAGEMSKLFGKSIKMSLLSTGIGALLLAFGALFSYFTKTIAGSEKLRVGMAGFKQIGIELQNSFSKLGEKIANIDWAGTFETVKKYNPYARAISAVWNLSRDALEKLNPEMKKYRLEIEANVKAAKEIEKLNIAYEKVNLQVEKDIATLENKKALQEIIADDNTRDFATRQAAAKETINLENQINDIKIANAQAELAIAVEQSRLSGNNNIEQIKRVNDLKIAVTKAETQKTIAIENAAKRQREVDRDLFEQKLDNVLDVYDRNKTVIEQQLQDETLSIEKRKELTNELIQSDIRNQKEIEQLYLEQTGKKIDLNELLKIDNVNTLNDILQNELKFDEIERNRLREVYMERKQYTQDLIKLRRGADSIQPIESKKTGEKNSENIKEQTQKDFDTWAEKFKQKQDIEKQKQDIEKLNEEKKKEARRQAFDESVAFANALFDLGTARREQEMTDIENKRQYELELAGNNEKKKAEINKKYDREAAKIKTEQAKADKNQALFNIAIQTGVNIVKAFGNPYLIALAAALGIAQAAAVSAKKIPKFKKGVIDFKGEGTETSDSNIVAISKGESVIKAASTKKAKNLLSAINSDGSKEQLIKAFLTDVGGLGGTIDNQKINYNEKFDKLIKQNEKLISVLSSKNSDNFDSWKVGKMIEKNQQRIIEKNKYLK